MKISAIIHTKNSEKTIKTALESVRWVDEVVVVDMHSSDNTISICKEYTKAIYTFDDVGYVEPARNFGIEKANGDWVLILDADEAIPAHLADKLRELANGLIDAWELPRKNLLFGHWVKSAGWWPDYNVRFFRKGAVVWGEKIHSKPTIQGTSNRLPAEEMYAIVHNNYPTVSDFITRMNNYTSIKVAEREAISGSPLLAFWNEFQNRYLHQKGYEDGIVGLHASLLQSVYEAVVRIKYWESQHAPNMPVDVKKELGMIVRQLAYWRADYMVNHTLGIQKLYWRVRRKLRR